VDLRAVLTHPELLQVLGQGRQDQVVPREDHQGCEWRLPLRLPLRLRSRLRLRLRLHLHPHLRLRLQMRLRL
jgi:hypothetical protein